MKPWKGNVKPVRRGVNTNIAYIQQHPEIFMELTNDTVIEVVGFDSRSVIMTHNLYTQLIDTIEGYRTVCGKNEPQEDVGLPTDEQVLEAADKGLNEVISLPNLPERLVQEINNGNAQLYSYLHSTYIIKLNERMAICVTNDGTFINAIPVSDIPSDSVALRIKETK